MLKRIAIAGATGAVGQLVRQMLEEREFPYESITFLASSRSAGKTLEFKGEQHTIKLLEPDAFDDIDLVIGSTPDDVAAEFVPWAVERGAVVVDESGYHRMLDHVPLVVPEVNPEAIQLPSRNHCQPQLQHDSDGGCDAAASRSVANQTGRRLDLPGDQRGRGGRPGRFG